MRIVLLVGTLICLASPANADLGKADVPESKPTLMSQTVFDAWCVEKDNDCTVKLINGRLSVDGSAGITSEQLITWSRDDNYRNSSGFVGGYHLYSYNFRYSTSSGDIRNAKIVFQNSEVSDKFYGLVKEWVSNKEHRCRYNFEYREVRCD